MTQEQKAKAYDEALEKARKYRDEEGFTEMEDLFPELAESEDERIRKTLIHIVKGACDKYGIKYRGDDITEEKLLAYLEKQKPADGKELLYVSNKSYNIGYRDGKMAAEQKTAKWSEDDEKKLELVTDFVFDFYPDPVMKYKLKDWLKSLCPQPKSKWSKEDNNIMEQIIMDYEGEIRRLSNSTIDRQLKPIYQKRIDWLKSLRPSWKPSEEQIGALNYAYGELFKREDVGHNILGPLQKLCDELKKLM